jgi:hypothetical protein
MLHMCIMYLSTRTHTHTFLIPSGRIDLIRVVDHELPEGVRSRQAVSWVGTGSPWSKDIDHINII